MLFRSPFSPETREKKTRDATADRPAKRYRNTPLARHACRHGRAGEPLFVHGTRDLLGKKFLDRLRFAHIQPELADYEDYLRVTIQQGRRRHELLNPRKYRYIRPFNDLPVGFNHVVGIVLFGFDVNIQGETVPNNCIATAFLIHMRPRGG